MVVACAAESVANSILHPGTTSLFVSINREESAEKIRYAREIYDALYPEWRVPLTSDNITGLAWANRSRVISMPQRPVRGKARAWFYLDEFAHYRLDKPIYIGTLPVMTKGGRMRIGSTTFGARGMFWEIGEQTTGRYPGYTRVITPWWEVTALLRPGVTVREASLVAPTLTTEERVERLANKRLQDIFANMPLDDFQQEYECVYVDETASYITWEDIFGCAMDERDPYVCRIARTAHEGYNVIEALANDIVNGRMTGAFVWGLDIGRKKDLTELTISEIVGENTVIVRAIISLDRQNFETQEAICRAVLDHLPVVRGYMDQNGLGMQLTESLNIRDGYGERAMPMPFSMQSKARMAADIKRRFQRRKRAGGIIIPSNRDLMYQIHSIRRVISPGGNVTFDVEASERHHADKFWSLALSCAAAETLERLAAYPVAGNVIETGRRTVDSEHPVAPDLDLPDPSRGFIDSRDMETLIRNGVASLLTAGMLAGLPEHVRQQLLLPEGTPNGENTEGG
jgi:phage FluMu gp28-like protein